MPHLLRIDSSADLRHSDSRALTALFTDEWAARGADRTVTHRDLHVNPLPHLEDAGLHWTPETRLDDDAVSRASELLQDELIDELLAADAVVIGAPLYNYTVPSTLKAWIDRIHIPGRLAGDVRPLAGRPVVAVVTRGAVYEGETAGWDHGSPVLDLILRGALGMDLTIVTQSITLGDRAEPLRPFAARGREERAAAAERISELARTV
ncbi:FMN-dependent NADH-azoreductase [Microbacterium indicum]|uniref:FMN-dependent NADH-azoreductase n=1 Tax=Microbacterium indicum TaxID=358100 RepID=UPI00041D062F|nr:NAD(P)H-dependent oxidoreductase [Microbacterium indicum]